MPRRHMNKLQRRQAGLRKARRVLKVWMNSIWAHVNPRDIDYDEQLHMLYSTRKPCSCWFCGHRRRLFGPTAQELRHMNDVKDLE